MDMNNGTATLPGLKTGSVQMDNSQEQQGFDIVRVLWRWKFLPIFGAVLGMALGYLYFTQQTPQYIASALVQVVSPIPQSYRMQPYDPKEVMTFSRADESMVIGSERVLRKAVERGNLADFPKLKGWQSDEIVEWILSGRKLSVQPAEKNINTTLIGISFVCEDAVLSAAVVNAIVDGYSDYLAEEFKTVGNEVYELTMKAQANIDKTYQTLRERNLQFRKDAPLIWTGNGTEDPYANNLQEINAKLVANSVERAIVSSKLKHAQEAIASNRKPEAILMWLSNSEAQDRPLPESELGTVEKPASSVMAESRRLEQQDLLKLRMEEHRFLSSVGEGHPALATIRQQITLLEEQIARLRESEKLEELEFKEAMKEKKDKEKVASEYQRLTPEERLEIRLQAMQENLAGLQDEETSLRVLAADNEKKSKEVSKFLQDHELYQRELESVQTMLDAYREKLKHIELLPSSVSQRTLKELNLPTVGGFYGPKLLPFLLGGGALGFLLLSGLAVLLDLADKSFRTPEDVATELGAPVIGHIPVMEADKLIKKPGQIADSSLCTIHHSRGRVSEAYRSVRTALFFSNRTGDLKVLQVTSPVPGDGKSTLSSNLSVTMAQSGRKVLLIDADFRRPRIAKLFGIDSEVGMATVVAGAAELDDAIHASPVANLSVMPGGKRPSNPAELLSSPRFAELLNMLRDKFDMIIVDTPPLLAVSDPSAVAAIVDGVVITMRLRRNVKPLVTRSAKILEAVDANVLGVVINGVSQEAGYGGYSYGYRDYRYAYNYRYGYGYKGYNKGYYAGGYGTKQYLDEPHDVDTDHVFANPETKITGRDSDDRNS